MLLCPRPVHHRRWCQQEDRQVPPPPRDTRRGGAGAAPQRSRHRRRRAVRPGVGHGCRKLGSNGPSAGPVPREQETTWLPASWTNSRSTPSARCAWTPSRRRTRAIRARPWPSRRSPTSSGSASSATTRRSPLAQPRPVRAVRRPCLDAAVVAAAPERRAGRRPRLRGARPSRPSRSTTSRPSASSARRCPGHPEYRLDQRRGDDHRPARPGRGHLGRHGASPGGGSPPATTGPALNCSTSTSTPCAGDGCMMEGISCEAASLAGPPQAPNLCWIYDNNRITIEGHTDIAFSEDVAARFVAYGWNVTHGRRRQRPRRCWTGVPIGQGRARAPDADRGAQPHRVRLAGRGHPARRTASRSARTRCRRPSSSSAGRRTPTSSCPTGSTSTSPAGIGAAGQGSPRGVGGAVRGVPGRAPGPRRPSSTGSQRRELPEGWDTRLAGFPADPKGAGHPRLLGQGAQRAGANGALADRRLGGPGPVDQDDAHFRGRRRASSPTTGRAQPHFGIREHAIGGRRQRHGAHQGPRPYWSGFLIFSDYARGADPALRRSWRSRSSTSSPTTRSASARTARPTSRSSSSPRCGRCRACWCSARPTPTRWPRLAGGHAAHGTSRSR